LRSVLVGTTPQVVMPWIVNAAVDTASAGILGACVTLVGVMNLLVLSVDRVLTPRAAQAYYEGGSAELRRVLGRTAVFLAIPLGLFCIGVFATGSMLAVLAYGDKFQQSGPLVAVLTLNTLVTGLGFVAANGLWATDKLRANFVADAGIMVVTLVAAALLVAPLGALGAAVATLAGSATGTLVRTIALARTLHNQDHQGHTTLGTDTDM
jgi:O-antigen/teichoic acid export membrane protein